MTYKEYTNITDLTNSMKDDIRRGIVELRKGNIEYRYLVKRKVRTTWFMYKQLQKHGRVTFKVYLVSGFWIWFIGVFKWWLK